MKLRRRELLKMGAVGAVAYTLPAIASNNGVANAQILARKGASILQGATDDTKTQFSLLYDVKVDLEIYVTDSKNQKWVADDVRIVSIPGHNKKITKVFFSNLHPGELFDLHVTDFKTEQTLDRRQFAMLSTQDEIFRFALCSCMDDGEHKADIWQNMVAQKPHVLFFIGDHVYADKGAPKTGADPAHLWKRFCEVRQTLEVFYSPRLIPIIGVWDDHDFGLNDTDSETYPYVKESQKNYLAFFAQDESHCSWLKRGPGISSAFQYGSQLVVLLDDRSFRKSRGSKDRYAHWGQSQENWVLDLLHQNHGPSWLLNGSQIFPAIFWKESVSGDHPEQFQGFLEELKKVKSKVIFGSGDVHYSEISRIEKEAIGYGTYEITSSSIHSKGLIGTPDIVPNKRRITGTGERNYILIEAKAEGFGTSFAATSFSGSGKPLFKKNLSVV